MLVRVLMPPVLVPSLAFRAGAGGRTRPMFRETFCSVGHYDGASLPRQDRNATQGGASPRPCRPFSSFPLSGGSGRQNADTDIQPRSRRGGVRSSLHLKHSVV